MDSTYNHRGTEEKTYAAWEKSGAFTPTIDRTKKPFTILLPLPNANDPMHMGHALFTIQDILIRYHRLKGDPTLWLPGGDHAGIETQFVFEKHLAKEGKSRFDFDRDTLYRLISEFVEQNKDINRGQMKRLGFSLDWTRYKYSLDPEITAIVLDTFRQLYKDKLIYRAERMVNYCTKCGTAFSDLEVNHEEKEDLLYYLDYGTIRIATARPETIFADVAVAVHPEDKRYKSLVGKTAVIPIINREIPVIADPVIKTDFGTGVLKVTPAHDETDFAIGQRHSLPVLKTIATSGRLTKVPEKYEGLRIKAAREKVAEDLKNAGKLVKTEPLTHTVTSCYRCKTTIEPMLLPQWFVKTKPLAEKAINAVKTGKTKIGPLPRFETMYYEWLENIRDWNISRQIVWGPRIPVWYCLDCNPEITVSFRNKAGETVHGSWQTVSASYSFAEVSAGLQTISAPVDARYELTPACNRCHGKLLLQETDTFDTWFLSGQWPLTTLSFPDGEDFSYFYPTSVLDTLWDILFFWVARMMMLGIYRTGKVPFETVHIHSRVVDRDGQKMSKSKGNVINPIEMADKYGADALRMALVYGVAPGSDIVITEEKIRGMRNFSNKLWNIGRLFFVSTRELPQSGKEIPFYDAKMHAALPDGDKRIISELNMLTTAVTDSIESYRFSDAAQSLHDFTWHRLADSYLEENKGRYKNGDLTALSVYRHILTTLVTLLHPFMPFVTEAVFTTIPRKQPDRMLISSNWPGAGTTG